jgi:hypothetical protein
MKLLKNSELMLKRIRRKGKYYKILGILRTMCIILYKK